MFDADDAASGFISDLLQRARRETDITVPSSPKGGRDYIHVTDAVDGLLALGTGQDEGIFNIAGGRTVLNQEVAEVFAKAGRRLTLTGQDQPPPQPRCDISRLKQLGVTPKDAAVAIAEILARPDFQIA